MSKPLKQRNCKSKTCRQPFQPVRRGLQISKHCCAACELDDAESNANLPRKPKEPKLLKQKKCKLCKELFTPFNSLTTCSPRCEFERLKKVAKKEYDLITAEMKKEFNDNDKTYWSERAQAECNKYILIRDKGKPCISCGTTARDIEYAAGHFVPRGRSAALRFNEFNIHRQCNNYCNNKMSANLIPYRQALVKLYGEEKVLWLEGYHEMPRYRIEDYKRIHAEFNTKIKELKNNSNIA